MQNIQTHCKKELIQNRGMGWGGPVCRQQQLARDPAVVAIIPFCPMKTIMYKGLYVELQEPSIYAWRAQESNRKSVFSREHAHKCKVRCYARSVQGDDQEYIKDPGMCVCKKNNCTRDSRLPTGTQEKES